MAGSLKVDGALLATTALLVVAFSPFVTTFAVPHFYLLLARPVKVQPRFLLSLLLLFAVLLLAMALEQ